MNIINILNTQCVQCSVELPYRGDTPVLNPGSLLDILITELPSLFKDILKDLGFDVSNWPDSFHISENSEDPLLTIIYPSLTGKGRTIDDILAHTKGPVLILDPNPIYTPSLGQGRQIVPVSMADLAIEILRRIGSYGISTEVRKRIEELCKVWVLIGMLYQGININKPFGEQPRVRYNIPAQIRIALNSIEQEEFYRRIWIMLEDRLQAEIKSGKVSIQVGWDVRDIHSNTPFAVVFRRHRGGVFLLHRANDMKISYWTPRKHSCEILLETEISTTNNNTQNKLSSTLQGWDVSQRSYRSPLEYVFKKVQDITRRTVQDVLDEIVADICDVVTGKKVY